MTETAFDSADAAAARAAEQARLRKERREAKIKAGGSDRLNRITGLGGGIPRDTAPAPAAPSPEATSTSSQSSNAATPTPPTKQQQHEDPEEVDISQHYYAPHTTARIPSSQHANNNSGGGGFTAPPDPNSMTEAQFRQMMLGFDPSGAAPGAGPGGDIGGNDPMMKLLSQMMSGGGPGGPGGPGAGPNPFSAMGMGGAGAGAGDPAAGATTTTDRYTVVWRLLHTAVALGLGLYIALWTSFSGTKLQREASAVLQTRDGGDGDGLGDRRFFWAFATAEAVLLTTRFFVDRGRSGSGGQPPSAMQAIVGMLPPPIKGLVEVGLRYGQVFGTVRSDVMVCIFVLGVCSWLRS